MMVAGVSLLAASALAQLAGRGVPIRSSPAKSDTFSTNLNQLALSARNDRYRLDEELSRSSGAFSPAEVDRLVQPVTRPPAVPVIQNRKIRKLLDEQKNGPSARPEDELNDLTGEEMMGVSQWDGQDRKKAPVSGGNKFYQNMARAQTGATNRLSDETKGLSNDDARLSKTEGEDKPLNPIQARLQEAAQGLQNFLKEDSKSKLLPEFQPSLSLSAPFNYQQHERTLAEKAQDLRLDQFRQMLQGDALKSAGFSGLPSLGGAAEPGSLGSSAFKPLAPAPAVVLPGSSLATRPAIPEITPPAASPPESTRKLFSPTVSELPRRKF